MAWVSRISVGSSDVTEVCGCSGLWGIGALGSELCFRGWCDKRLGGRLGYLLGYTVAAMQGHGLVASSAAVVPHLPRSKPQETRQQRQGGANQSVLPCLDTTWALKLGNNALNEGVKSQNTRANPPEPGCRQC